MQDGEGRPHRGLASRPEHGAEPSPSVSETFFYEARFDILAPDVVLISVDQVYFYVHKSRLLLASRNGFNYAFFSPPDNRFLPMQLQPQSISVPENSETLSIVLHVIYRLDFGINNPSFQSLVAAMNALTKYGVPLQTYMLPVTELYSLFLSHARQSPLEGYTVAAEHDLSNIAEVISHHLLSFQVTDLSDDLAARMGAVYLKRLCTMLYNRMQDLRRLVFEPPQPHGATPECYIQGQRLLTRVWAMAVAQLVWEVKPDTSGSLIQSIMGSFKSQLTCARCQDLMDRRIAGIVQEWSTTG